MVGCSFILTCPSAPARKLGAYRRRCAGRKFRPVQPGPFDLSHAAVGSKQKKTNRSQHSSSSRSWLDPHVPFGGARCRASCPLRWSSVPTLTGLPRHCRTPALAGRPRRRSPHSPSPPPPLPLVAALAAGRSPSRHRLLSFSPNPCIQQAFTPLVAASSPGDGRSSGNVSRRSQHPKRRDR